MAKTGSAGPGGTITYTISVTNNGPASATGVTLTDALPSTVSFVSINATGGQTDQTITFLPLPGKTFGDPPFTVNATATSGLPVSFVASGDCSIAGNIVSLTGAGSCTVTASQSGNAQYNPAPPVSQTFAIARASQTITFGPLGNKSFGDPPFAVSAGASSGLPVNFSIVAGPATISGNTVTLTGVGTVTLRASQAGNANFNPAPDVDRSFNVLDTTPPTITRLTVSPSQIWPLNKAMVPVTVTVTASDNADPAPVCQLVTIASNEPITANDALITGPLTASLRAARLGSGHGRVYTLTVRCADASGNTVTGTVSVTVPHDQSGH